MDQEITQTQSDKKQYILAGGLVFVILLLTFGIYYLTKGNLLLKNAALENSAQTNTESTETPNDIDIPSTVNCYQFKNLEEALKRIDIACILDLNGTAQNTTLSDLAKLTNLNEINLSNNNLTEFPEVLFRMENILIINLSNNKLSTIPETMKNSKLIKTLQVLDLTGNSISLSEQQRIQSLLPNVEITF